MSIPQCVLDYNKKKGTNKILPMSMAKSLYQKRFFSGSFGVDKMLGGGAAFRRIQLLYGAKSCLDGTSFINYEVWSDGKRRNSKGGTIQRLYERFTGDTSEGSKYGRHLQQNENTKFYVKSVNENNLVVRNEVLDVVRCGKKECFLVTTDAGMKIVSTAEHKYLTPTGYKALKDIKVGDTLFANTNNRVKGRKKDEWRPDVMVKYHPYFPTKKVKDVYNGKVTFYTYYRGQKARVAYEAYLNNMSFDDYVNALNTEPKEKIDKLKFLSTKMHVHHKDEDFTNNDISNLEIVDPSVHGKIHMADRLDNLRIAVEATKVIAIDCVGIRETYDLKCAYPYNNYIADGIVVHNSGKNAIMNQMMAYNQRICRHCHGVMPEYREETDRWADVLVYILGTPYCTCNRSEPRVMLFYDFEKTLTIEDAKSTSIAKYFKKDTEEEVSANEFNEFAVRLDDLKEKGRLSADEKKEIVELEAWFTNIDTQTETVDMMNSADYLVACGVKTDILNVMTPETADEGIDSLPEMIKSKQIDIIMWDSLQASMTKYVGERSVEDATMGAEAKTNGLMMRKINMAYTAEDLADESDAYKPPVIITSQVRSSIGGFFPKADSYSGGKAIEHSISTALEIKRGAFLSAAGTEAKKGEVYHGQEVCVRADKNKLATPFTKCKYNYYFKACEAGPVGFIDYFDELLSIAIESGIIAQGGGGNYTFKDVKVRGKENLVAEAKRDPRFLNEVYSEIKNI